MSSTEIAVLDRGGGVALSEHARMTSVGLQLAEGTTDQEIQEIAGGLGAINDAAAFGVGDLANFYREHFPAGYREWIDRPTPTKGLDNKTVKVYAAVAAFYPHEQRARHMAVYAGHPGVSFSHFSRVRRYGKEIAEYWLDRAATEGLSLGDLEAQIDAGAIGADDVPVLREESATTRGMWTWLGPPEDPNRHLLVCGDAKDPSYFEPYLQAMGGKPTMIWTDPPYGVDYVSIGRQMKANKLWMSKTEILERIRDGEEIEGIKEITDDQREALPELLLAAFTNMRNAAIPCAPFYVSGPTGNNIALFLAAFDAAGWDFRQLLIWRKNVMVFGRSDYHHQHEPVFYGYTGSDMALGRIQDMQGRNADDPWGTRWYGPNNATTVFDVQRPSSSDDHPTMKPIKLITEMIENSSRPGEIVMDVFSGSGSTLVAADLTGRRCFAIEYDPQYYDVIVRRYEQHLYNRAQGLVIEATAVEDPAEPATSMGEE